MLLSLAAWNLEVTGVAGCVSGDGVVRVAASLEGGWADSPAASARWRQEVFWRHGWDVALGDFVESG